MLFPADRPAPFEKAYATSSQRTKNGSVHPTDTFTDRNLILYIGLPQVFLSARGEVAPTHSVIVSCARFVRSSQGARGQHGCFFECADPALAEVQGFDQENV